MAGDWLLELSWLSPVAVGIPGSTAGGFVEFPGKLQPARQDNRIAMPAPSWIPARMTLELLMNKFGRSGISDQSGGSQQRES